MEEKNAVYHENVWRNVFLQERIDTHWLSYNPHAFLPLDYDSFLKTGVFSKLEIHRPSCPSESSPVFIVGCGRSGSSLLGKLLSAHSDVLFLNEPRQVWMQVFPEYDIWSVKAKERLGSLTMNHSLPTPEQTLKLRSLFSELQSVTCRSVLVEKTPEHAFKLDWLSKVFPKCKVIFVKRDALSTCRSISRFQPSMWYGFKDEYKWKQLAQLIPEFQDELRLSEDFMDLANRPDEYLAKAIVEWALSLLSSRRFANKLSPGEKNTRYLEIHYQDLVEFPKEKIREVLKFVNLEDETEMLKLSKDLIQGHKSPASPLRRSSVNSDLTEDDIIDLAGDNFKRLMNN